MAAYCVCAHDPTLVCCECSVASLPVKALPASPAAPTAAGGCGCTSSRTRSGSWPHATAQHDTHLKLLAATVYSPIQCGSLALQGGQGRHGARARGSQARHRCRLPAARAPCQNRPTTGADSATLKQQTGQTPSSSPRSSLAHSGNLHEYRKQLMNVHLRGSGVFV